MIYCKNCKFGVKFSESNEYYCREFTEYDCKELLIFFFYFIDALTEGGLKMKKIEELLA